MQNVPNFLEFIGEFVNSQYSDDLNHFITVKDYNEKDYRFILAKIDASPKDNFWVLSIKKITCSSTNEFSFDCDFYILTENFSWKNKLHVLDIFYKINQIHSEQPWGKPFAFTLEESEFRKKPCILVSFIFTIQENILPDTES